MATRSPSHLAGWVAIVAALGITVGTAGPTRAVVPAPGATSRILPYAGSSQLLVYGITASAETVRNYLQVAGPHTQLSVLTASGKRQELIDTGDQPAVPISVVGSVVALANANVASTVDAWDLSNDTHITVALTNEGLFVGASPNGFIYAQGKGRHHRHLFEQSFDGKVTDLGNPLDRPSFVTVTGPGGIIVSRRTSAVSNPDAYMRWSHLGTFRRLPRVPGSNPCNDLANRFAACGQYLLPLNGTEPIAPLKERCVGPTVVFHASSVRICASGRLHRIDRNGRTSQAPTPYAWQQVIHAFNKLIVGSPDQAALEALTSIKAKPKVLLTA